jgi:hypothetical protein
MNPDKGGKDTSACSELATQVNVKYRENLCESWF